MPDLAGDPQAGPQVGTGRLSVFLGMAPGVGTTSRMLEEARRRFEGGTDVVIGFVEPRERPRPMELLEGLEVIPRLRAEYRGIVIEEMDTDALIARRPAVAVVDELAHTNLPGLPREKRWQDVVVIRDAGIHVLSTLDIQHLESVADAVATITGSAVGERLPDAVLETADEVELVDLSPRALRQRIEQGDVYPADRAGIALERFFTEGNLTALRELALRLVARRVEGQLEGITAGGGEHLARVTERVMVLVDDSPAAARAVRKAASLASSIHAALVAIVVETPDFEHQPRDRAREVRETVDDAIDLGADVVWAEASDPAIGLERIARARRATHIVLPYPGRPRIARRLRPSLSDRLLERLPDVEIHLVATSGSDAARRGVAG